MTFACCELYVCRGVAWKSCRYWCFWSMVVHLPAIKHRTFYCSIQTVLFLVLPINFLTLWQSYGTLNFVQFILAHPILAKCDMYKYWMMQSFPCMCLYTHSNPVLNILHSAHLTDIFPHGVIIGEASLQNSHQKAFGGVACEKLFTTRSVEALNANTVLNNLWQSKWVLFITALWRVHNSDNRWAVLFWSFYIKLYKDW